MNLHSSFVSVVCIKMKDLCTYLRNVETVLNRFCNSFCAENLSWIWNLCIDKVRFIQYNISINYKMTTWKIKRKDKNVLRKLNNYKDDGNHLLKPHFDTVYVSRNLICFLFLTSNSYQSLYYISYIFCFDLLLSWSCTLSQVTSRLISIMCHSLY